MDLHPYTHVILDEDSGEAIGAVRDIDELASGERFGIAFYFAASTPPTYAWLGDMHLLPLAEAAPHVRNHVTWAVANALVA